MSQFHHTDREDGDIRLAIEDTHLLLEVLYGVPASLACDQDARIEN